MKAGTTSLHADLSIVRGVYMSENKEPEILLNNSAESILNLYRNLFLFSGKSTFYWGEASTAYTKRKYSEIAARNFHALSGSEKTKLIFVYRDPIKRAVSQVKHDLAHGVITYKNLFSNAYLDEVVSNSDYVNCIKPWLDKFDIKNFHFIRFEDYISRKSEVIKQTLDFLGLQVGFDNNIQQETVLNSSSDRVVLPGWVRRITVNTHIYQYFLKPLINKKTRNALAKILSKRRVAEITDEDLDRLSSLIANKFNDGDFIDFESFLLGVKR